MLEPDALQQSAGRDLPFYGSELTRRAGYLLRRSHRLHAQLWAAAVPQGLTSPQFGILSVIDRHPEIDQRTLGELTSLDRASVTNIITRLVDRGMVQRARDPQDARRRILSLDGDIRGEIRAARAAASAVWTKMFEPVPERERTAFVERLERIANFVPEERDAGSLFRRLDQRRAATWSNLTGNILTGAQYAVVHVVRQQPGVSQTEISDLAAVDRSTAAEIIDRLEERGWVARKSDPRDARVRRVSMTTSSLETLERLDTPIAEVQRQLLSPIPAAEQGELLSNWALVAYRGQIPIDRV